MDRSYSSKDKIYRIPLENVGDVAHNMCNAAYNECARNSQIFGMQVEGGLFLNHQSFDPCIAFEQDDLPRFFPSLQPLSTKKAQEGIILTKCLRYSTLGDRVADYHMLLAKIDLVELRVAQQMGVYRGNSTLKVSNLAAMAEHFPPFASGQERKLIHYASFRVGSECAYGIMHDANNLVCDTKVVELIFSRFGIQASR